MVIDTSALIAFLRDEAEALPIQDAMTSAGRRYISALTLFECRTVLWSRFGAEMVQGLHDLLDGWGPEIRTFDPEQAGLAFYAYRRFGKGSGHKAQLNFVRLCGLCTRQVPRPAATVQGQRFRSHRRPLGARLSFSADRR